jgi:hypothetical protein
LVCFFNDLRWRSREDCGTSRPGKGLAENLGTPAGIDFQCGSGAHPKLRNTGPPDPEMRSPALAEHEHRANRKSSKSQKDNTPHHTDPQDYDRELSLYDGTIWIGSLGQNGRRWDAFSTVLTLRFIGSFSSLKEASDAVSAAWDGAS